MFRPEESIHCVATVVPVPSGEARIGLPSDPRVRLDQVGNVSLWPRVEVRALEVGVAAGGEHVLEIANESADHDLLLAAGGPGPCHSKCDKKGGCRRQAAG